MTSPTRATASDRRLYWVGTVLVTLTVAGLLLFRILKPGSATDATLLVDIGIIMAIAMAKAYLIGREFMEIRLAVRWVRHVYCAWLVTTWLAIMAATYAGMHLTAHIHFI